MKEMKEREIENIEIRTKKILQEVIDRLQKKRMVLLSIKDTS